MPRAESTGRGPARPLPASGVDAEGRALPISDDEWRARLTALERELTAIDAADNDPPDALERMMRGLDEDRAAAGMRPLFRGGD